jgi:pantoate--beta-alanine ligase
MKIITTIPQLRKTIATMRRKGRSIGFVPTMGALHNGHLSLIRRSKKQSDITVLSIFVNPAQFGPKEDYKKYPRTWPADIQKARRDGVEIVFAPTAHAMYPRGFATWVSMDKSITDTVLCGRSRPGHFHGVATVVAKLLNLVQPDIMYLGQKDAQQCVVLHRMVNDLNIPTRVVVCPTVREKDGLAMSSRNQYLSSAERQEAIALYQALCLGRDLIRNRERHASRICSAMRQHVQKNSRGVIDYLNAVDPATLQSLRKIRGAVLLAGAVRFGNTRLIDNIIVPTYNG